MFLNNGLGDYPVQSLGDNYIITDGAGNVYDNDAAYYDAVAIAEQNSAVQAASNPVVPSAVFGGKTATAIEAPKETAQSVQTPSNTGVITMSTPSNAGVINVYAVQQAIYDYAHTLPFGSTPANEKIAVAKLGAMAKLKGWTCEDIGVALGFSTGAIVQYFADHQIAGVKVSANGSDSTGSTSSGFGAVGMAAAAIAAYLFIA